MNTLSPFRLVAIAAALSMASLASATVVSSNVSASSAGAESATSARWISASFTTDANPYTLNSVVLLLANTAAGSAQLSVYSDGGYQPGSLLGTLTPPASYSGTLANTTFTASGISLTASTTYWLVLRPSSGTFTWSWTNDNTGTGSGFTHVWGASEDSGSTWWSDDIYPLQFTVNATIPGACTGASIGTPPSAASASCGGTANFTVAAAGTAPFTYSWRKGGTPLSDGLNIAGSASDSLTISNTLPVDAGSYDVVVTNSCGNATSTAVSLTINGSVPSISQQPATQTVCINGPATLSVTATGVDSYQWRKGGVPINGATMNSYTISPAVTASAGSYDVLLANTCGTTTSNAAVLSICVADFNCNGAISVQDIFDFLLAYFTNNLTADINGSGDDSVQDIFDFLAAYFSGCS